jgi:hypothetical protein
MLWNNQLIGFLFTITESRLMGKKSTLTIHLLIVGWQPAWFSFLHSPWKAAT